MRAFPGSVNSNVLLAEAFARDDLIPRDGNPGIGASPVKPMAETPKIVVRKDAMSRFKMFSIVALVFGFLGSVMLAASMNRLFRPILLSLNAFDTTLKAYLGGDQNVPVFRGLDKHLDRGVIANKRLSVAGFLLLAIGFILQLVALFI
jgi:hypothetical protein